MKANKKVVKAVKNANTRKEKAALKIKRETLLRRVKTAEKIFVGSMATMASGLVYMNAKKNKINPVGPVILTVTSVIGSWVIGKAAGLKLGEKISNAIENRRKNAKVESKKAA